MDDMPVIRCSRNKVQSGTRFSLYFQHDGKMDQLQCRKWMEMDDEYPEYLSLRPLITTVRSKGTNIEICHPHDLCFVVASLRLEFHHFSHFFLVTSFNPCLSLGFSKGGPIASIWHCIAAGDGRGQDGGSRCTGAGGIH